MASYSFCLALPCGVARYFRLYSFRSALCFWKYAVDLATILALFFW